VQAPIEQVTVECVYTRGPSTPNQVRDQSASRAEIKAGDLLRNP
jgi:hypothetical protein